MRSTRLQFVVLLATLWFVGVPLVYLAFGATHAFGDTTTITLRYLRKVFLSGAYWVPLRNTLELSAAVAVGATLIGAGLGFVVARVRLYAASWWDVALMSPIFISPFIGIIGWITLAGPQAGLLNSALRVFGGVQVDVFTLTGAIFTMSLFLAPFSYALVRHSAERLDPALEEAAAICGATRWRIAQHVLLPLLWPSLLSGMVFAFVLAAEMFSIPGLLLTPHGYPVLAYSIYQRTTQFPLDYSEAAAMGFLLLLLTACGMLAYAQLVRVQARYVTVGARGARRAAENTHKSLRMLASGACLAYVLLAVVMPLGAITLRALLPYFSGTFGLGDLSFANIVATLRDSAVRDALVNSLVVTTVSTSLLLVLAFAIAVARVRAPTIVARLSSTLASLPIGVPGVLIGVGLLWAYIRTPVYATVAILVLVMLARFLPVIVRMFETALMQVDRSLEESAAICGASPSRVTWHVRLPLLAGTVRSALMVGTSQVFNELTASALLFTATSGVLPVVVFNYMFDGDYARASACALLQVVILIALFSAVTFVARARSSTRALAA